MIPAKVQNRVIVMTQENQARKTRVLISGFGGYPDNPVNPGPTLVRGLADEFADHAAIELRSVVLSVTFNSCWEELKREIGAFAPDLVLSFGLRPDTASFDLEAIARNLLDNDRQDAKGSTPVAGPIDSQGPQTLPSTLPLETLRQALADASIPVRILNSGANYVCNYLFYRLMREGNVPMAGFIHIPYSIEAAPHYTGDKRISPLPEQTLQKGAALLIETAACHWQLQ